MVAETVLYTDGVVERKLQRTAVYICDEVLQVVKEVEQCRNVEVENVSHTNVLATNIHSALMKLNKLLLNTGSKGLYYVLLHLQRYSQLSTDKLSGRKLTCPNYKYATVHVCRAR